MKIFKNISIMASAAVMLLCGCSEWTQPENLNFRPLTPEEKDPAAYAEYLAAIREYKASEHNVMILTMEGTSEYPSSQNQHIMAMPDSADYVCVKIEDKLHEVIAAEIPAVLEKKGTKTLVSVDHAVINAAWTALEDERVDKGEAPGTQEELAAFFTEQTEKLVARCNEYGFGGLMVSFQGTKAGAAGVAQAAFIEVIKKFHQENPEKELIFRGGARNIIDQEFLNEFKYIIVIAGEERKLSLLPGRSLGSTAPKDRVIMELTVPSADEPEQVGMSPVEAATWLWTEIENPSFTPRGLCVENAHDDYFCKDMAFKNIRAAITVLNTKPTVEE
jgi:hypothetical protein